MKKIGRRLRNEEGNVLITAFIFLIILTMIGIFATRTAELEISISGNEIPYKRNFYLAEAGLYREAAELGRGNYTGFDVNTLDLPLFLAGRVGDDVSTAPGITVPGPDHVAFGQTYDFEVEYLGYFFAPGSSALDTVRYDYRVDVTANNVQVKSRLYKIGPKAE